MSTALETRRRERWEAVKMCDPPCPEAAYCFNCDVGRAKRESIASERTWFSLDMKPDDPQQPEWITAVGGWHPEGAWTPHLQTAVEFWRSQNGTHPSAEPEPGLPTPITITIDAVPQPGLAHITISNGTVTLLHRFPWRYQTDPARIIRQYRLVDPDSDHHRQLLELLPATAEQARGMEPHQEPTVIFPGDSVDFPDDIKLPSGLAISSDPLAPTIIGGAAKVGKSHLLLLLAAELAGTGRKVAVVAAEGANAWYKRSRHYPEHLRPLIVGGTPVGDREAEATARQIDRYDPEVVMVDPLVNVLAALGVDENDSASFGTAMSVFKQWAGDRLLVIAHHLGKDPKRGLRGSSAILGAAGIVYRCSPAPKSMRGICVVAGTDWRNGDPADIASGLLQYQPHGQLHLTNDQPNTSAEADLVDVKTTVEDAIYVELEATGGSTFNPLRQTIRQQTKVSYALFGSILKALVECELIVKDTEERYPTYRLP